MRAEEAIIPSGPRFHRRELHNKEMEVRSSRDNGFVSDSCCELQVETHVLTFVFLRLETRLDVSLLH